MNSITEFRGAYAPLSNFYVGPNGDCVEVSFQAFKTVVPSEREAILMCRGEPKRAKRLGRSCTLRADWDNIKVYVMSFLVAAKFSSNLNLAELLLSTRGSTLVEGNYWHDNFWGACTCVGCHDKIKQNQLGTILMSVRATLDKTLPNV